MNIFNYKDLSFSEIKGENFHVLTMNFLDYNEQFREITITWSSIGRKSFWLAQFSGLTTEYTGDLIEVLDKVIKHYDSQKHKDETKCKN